MQYHISEVVRQNGTLIETNPLPIAKPQNSLAVICHVFYTDVWQEIEAYLQKIDTPFDLFVTVATGTDDAVIEHILTAFEDVRLYKVENRGRDVLPFLQIMRLIGTQHYRYLCKLHTKKSVTIDNGDAWRKLLYFDLVGSQEIVTQTLQRFETESDTGIITGKNLVLSALRFNFGNMERVQALCEEAGLPFTSNFDFPAGTMFWIRPQILEPLVSLFEEGKLSFEPEQGQTDHTMAHAIERFIGLLCHIDGYKIEESNSDYRKLDAKTLDALSVLAFSQKFSYDLQIHERDLMIQERDEQLYALMTSPAYKFVNTFEKLGFLFRTLLHFNLQKVNSHGTDEHKLAMAIKRRIPERLFVLIKQVLKRKTRITQPEAFWNKPLSASAVLHSKRVLIVAELSIPQCTKYRVEQKVEMLDLLGYETDVVSWTEYLQARNLMQLCSMVFFYRVPAEETVMMLMDEAHRLGLKTFFDVDDLIFDEALLKENINIQQLPQKVQKQVFDGAQKYRKSLCTADYGTASTAVLAEEMTRHSGHETFLLPNCLDKTLLHFATQPKKIKGDNTVTIVYGSGTSTHDIDFQEAADALFELLLAYPNLRFVVHGTLTLPETFDSVKSQITVIPFMEASAYYQALFNYDINIAPLEPTLFNNAKSNIKYLEASVLRLPTVASNVREFTAVIENGVNGFLASSKETWKHALETLINDPDLRTKMGEAACQTVLEQYRIEEVANRYMLPLLERFMPPAPQKRRKVVLANILYKPISFGGATIVVEELARKLSQQSDYEVTIFTAFFDSGNLLYDDYDLVRYEADGIPVMLMRLPEPMLAMMEYRNEKMEEVFASILHAHRPDVVHFHSIQQLSASIALPCQKMQIPYVITLHDMWWLCERQFMVTPEGDYCGQTTIDPDFCQTHCNKNRRFTYERTRFLKQVLDEAALLLTPSQFQKEMYLANGIDADKLQVNKNGIRFPASGYKKEHGEKIRFAYVGGNADHKGYSFIKKILETLDREDYTLVLVDLERKHGYNSIFESDWDIKGELVISNGYENTIEDMDRFYADIDVLLFPSQCKESFGLTVREALVRDVWVISTDAGGVTEDIKEGENGNIVRMDDTLGFKEQIVSAIERFDILKTYENPYKQEIRSFDEQAEELVSFYNTLLEPPRHD